MPFAVPVSAETGKLNPHAGHVPLRFRGMRRGNFAILAAGREKKVLCNLELKSPISATTTAANGLVYVATMKELMAVGK